MLVERGEAFIENQLPLPDCQKERLVWGYIMGDLIERLLPGGEMAIAPPHCLAASFTWKKEEKATPVTELRWQVEELNSERTTI